MKYYFTYVKFLKITELQKFSRRYRSSIFGGVFFSSACVFSWAVNRRGGSDNLCHLFNLKQTQARENKEEF